MKVLLLMQSTFALATKRVLLSGSDSQNFLGKPWIRFLLRCVPSSFRREVALWFLARSPHYFYRTKDNQELNTRAFLEAEFRRNQSHRTELINKLVYPYLNRQARIVDYGCGPGFLAKAASLHVKEVIAYDISDGVLACAEIINGASNIVYKIAPNGPIAPKERQSVDLIYSFAVIQHVSDAVFVSILKTWYDLLKPSGIVVCHIVVDDENWKTEAEWRADRSLYGRLKLKLGLNCFGRKLNDIKKIFESNGFSFDNSFVIGDRFNIEDKDLAQQHLFITKRVELPNCGTILS